MGVPAYGSMAKLSRQVGEGRWTPEEAQAVLDMLERSGLSVQRFAEQEGLLAERLYRWRRKLRRTAPAAFVEVAVPAVQRCGVEVSLSSGVVIRFAESARLQVIMQLVQMLREQERC